MSSATAYSVSWFNLFTFPDLVAPSESLKSRLEQIHHFSAEALFVIALIHIAAAIKHATFDRDGVLARMSSIGSVTSFGIVVIAAAVFFAPVDPEYPQATGESSPATPPTSVKSEPPIQRTTTLSAWQIDYERSFIRFIGEQAGADFTGHWLDWQAEIYFAKDRLDESSALVTIRTSGVDTQDQERDSSLAEPEWFDAENYPHVYFQATTFESSTDDRYRTRGTLTVKDFAAPIDFAFTIEQNGSDVVLNGSATLDRLAHQIGTGEWQDPTWVGQYVTVEVRVVAEVGHDE